MARAVCVVCAYGRAGGFTCRRNKPQLVTHSPGLHRQLRRLLGALQYLPGMSNPPLTLTDVVIAGHKRINDEQHGDKQTTCNTAACRPGKSVRIPYRKRRFQNQRNQGGKSWDVCLGPWLARCPTTACPHSIVHCTLLIAER